MQPFGSPNVSLEPFFTIIVISVISAVQYNCIGVIVLSLDILRHTTLLNNRFLLNKLPTYLDQSLDK